MRSPNRTHDRQSFFKYMSTATAKAVLTKKTLRWSSPLLFNDPFDVPRELSFGITPEDIVQAQARRVSALIEHPPEDTSHLEPRLRLAIDTVRKDMSLDLKQKLLLNLQEFSAAHRPTSKSMDALRELWRGWLPNHRILCLTESATHAAMWHHYADQYQGIVLEFRCLDELDGAWLAAKPVTYPPQRPAIYTADGWAELFTMPNQAAIRAILHTAIYTKSPDWSYEAEWRVATFMRPTNTGLFTDYDFDSRELAAIYFGPLTSSGDRQSLTALADGFPDIKLRSVSIGMNREFLFNNV